MYKICFYVPVTHVDTVKNAMFAKGGGKIGEYSCCAWQVLGEGQFLPSEKSHAFIGAANILEKVQEYKVEMVCNEVFIYDVIAALKQAHPYETPAYQVIKVENF